MTAPSRNVLVVDDEPQIVRGLKVILRGAGYSVETAARTTRGKPQAPYFLADSK